MVPRADFKNQIRKLLFRSKLSKRKNEKCIRPAGLKKMVGEGGEPVSFSLNTNFDESVVKVSWQACEMELKITLHTSTPLHSIFSAVADLKIVHVL